MLFALGGWVLIAAALVATGLRVVAIVALRGVLYVVARRPTISRRILQERSAQLSQDYGAAIKTAVVWALAAVAAEFLAAITIGISENLGVNSIEQLRTAMDEWIERGSAGHLGIGLLAGAIIEGLVRRPQVDRLMLSLLAVAILLSLGLHLASTVESGREDLVAMTNASLLPILAAILLGGWMTYWDALNRQE